MPSLLAKSWRALRAAFSAIPRPFRRVGRSCAALALSLAVAPAGASAQCQSEWLRSDWFNTSDYLQDVEVMPNGDLVVCGNFMSPFSRIARWDGLQWTSLGSGLSANARCMTTLPDGRLVVGIVNAVMVWDGASWSQLGGSFNGGVAEMTVRNGELVVGGSFTLAGSSAVSRIARWDGTSWMPLGSGLSSGPSDLAVLSNGDLIAVGAFTAPGRFVARWDGVSWAAMGAGPSTPNAMQVNTVAQDPVSGNLWIGGSLQFGWGGFIEQWNGTAWVPVNANASTSEVRSLMFLPSWGLMAFGSITLGGQGPRGAARWTGTSWQFLSASSQYPAEPTNAYDGAILGDGTLVVMQLWDLRRFGCPDGLAQTSTFGTGCYRQSRAFYEHFPVPPAVFDLGNSTLHLTPSGTAYSVHHAAGAPLFHTPASPDLGLGDDENSAMITLPFPLPVGVGFVTDIQVGSNGYVNMNWDGTPWAYSGNTTLFRTGPHRHAPLYGDWDPATGAGSGTVHVDIDPNAQVVYVTWLNIQQYGAPGAVSTFQIALWASGAVEYRYQACAFSGTPALVGWSPGNVYVDSGSRDLTAGPFTTPLLDIEALAHRTQSRPAVGYSTGLETINLPANSPFGCTVIGWGQHNPGVELSALGMPGCFQYSSADVAVLFLPGPQAIGYHTLSIPPMAALIGAHLYSQGLAFVPGVNPLGAITSNGVDLRLGTL